MKAEYPIQMLCRSFNVSASGYYDWKQRQNQPGVRQREDEGLAVEIHRIHQKSRFTYGSPRVHHQLREEHRHHGRKRIARLMKQLGLYGRQRRRWRVQTTDSTHGEPIAPNRLKEQPKPDAVNRVWVSDITYIPTGQGWLYLAGIMDLYSRRIVGWAMGEHLDADLVLRAWNMAVTHRHPSTGLIQHSDRGVQYACRNYRQALSSVGALASMSRRACCYDNATMESFWSTLKNELVHRSHFENPDQARTAIFDYIETFYNRTRLHSALGYKSPIDFENQNN